VENPLSLVLLLTAAAFLLASLWPSLAKFRAGSSEE
jgi:hypothetical protein